MLQSWDVNTGQPMVQIGDRLYKFLGIASVGYSYTGTAQSGTIVDGRFTAYPACVPFAFVLDGGLQTRGGSPSLNISGNTLTWSYPLSGSNTDWRPNTTFAYGIF